MVNNLQKECFLMIFCNLDGILVRCLWQFRTIFGGKNGHENSRRLSDFTFIETK